jgi:hypothetical protein
MSVLTDCPTWMKWTSSVSFVVAAVGGSSLVAGEDCLTCSLVRASDLPGSPPAQLARNTSPAASRITTDCFDEHYTSPTNELTVQDV